METTVLGLETNLSKVVRRLLQSHEEEQTSTVQELRGHIDGLILLSFGLDRIFENLPQSLTATRQEITNAREQIEDLYAKIQTLSHRLRSPKLQFLGIAPVAASFCRDFSRQNNIPIDFESEDVPEDLSPQVKLALFHVLQEAVRNAVAHSGSQRVRVSLKGETNQVDLFVCDTGKGFVPDDALDGCGLTIMKERMKMVDGYFSMDSQPHIGTTIHACVPLKQRATRAATS